MASEGIGFDGSAIEGFASAIIVWRFTGDRVSSEAAEVRAQKLVAIQFFVLAPYVAFESVRALIAGEHPDTSWLGIALAALHGRGAAPGGLEESRLRLNFDDGFGHVQLAFQ